MIFSQAGNHVYHQKWMENPGYPVHPPFTTWDLSPPRCQVARTPGCARQRHRALVGEENYASFDYNGDLWGYHVVTSQEIEYVKSTSVQI